MPFQMDNRSFKKTCTAVARGFNTSEPSSPPTRLATETVSPAASALKLLLATYGSRGDVEPMIALAHTLCERGHSVHLCVPDNAISSVKGYGFSCSSSGVDYHFCFGSGDGTYRIFPRVASQISRQLESALNAASGVDAIVAGGLHAGASSVAQLLGVPYFYMLLSQRYLRCTRQPGMFSSIMWSPIDLASAILSAPLSLTRMRHRLPPVLSAYRQVVTSGTLFIACDPLLCQASLDYPGVVTGAWRRPLQQVYQCLRREGVYIGFGSMIHSNPIALSELLARAVADINEPVTLYRGWSGLTSASPQMVLVDEVDHDQLFRQVRVVVHHGGAGTVAAAIRAGVPQVIVPHRGDQFYFARQLQRLGVAPPPVPLSRLSVSRLSSAISAAMTPPFQLTASDLARQVRPLNGPLNAVLHIEASVANCSRKRSTFRP